MALGVAAGCGTMVELPEADAIPVVEGLLLADSATSLFRVTWALRSEHQRAEPIAPELVRLRLSGPTGSAPLVAAADSPGFLRAALPITRGAVYRLVGRVGDREVEAVTSVPARFEVAEPREPLWLRPDSIGRPPFRWSAVGASGFFARGARLSPGVRIDTRDTAGFLILERPDPGADSTPLTFFAISPAADDYLFGGPHPRTNIPGAFGYLGGAIAVRRVVRWR